MGFLDKSIFPVVSLLQGLGCGVEIVVNIYDCDCCACIPDCCCRAAIDSKLREFVCNLGIYRKMEFGVGTVLSFGVNDYTHLMLGFGVQGSRC